MSSAFQKRERIGRELHALEISTGPNPMGPQRLRRFKQLAIETSRVDAELAFEEEQRDNLAFTKFLIYGANHPSHTPDTRARLQRMAERRDMGTGGQAAYPAATAGFFVPMEMTDKIIDSMRWAGPMLDDRWTSIERTKTGARRAFPSSDDATASGLLVPESSQISVIDVDQPGASYLGAWKFGASFKVSQEFLMDTPNVDEHVSKWLGVRLGARAQYLPDERLRNE